MDGSGEVNKSHIICGHYRICPNRSTLPNRSTPPFREQKLHVNVYICNKMESLSNQNDIYKIFLVFVVCPFAGTILAPIDGSLQPSWPHNK